MKSTRRVPNLATGNSRNRSSASLHNMQRLRKHPRSSQACRDGQGFAPLTLADKAGIFKKNGPQMSKSR